MRRSSALQLLAPVLVLGLLVAGCGSSSGTKRAVTVVQTFTSSSGPAGPATGSSIVVGVPSAQGSAAQSTGKSGAAGSSSSAPKTSAKASSTAAATRSTPVATSAATGPAAPTTSKVDPLAVDCGALLAQNDVQRIAGVAIPATNSRIKDVANPKTGSTGSIRCLYGVTAGKQKLSLRLTKYTSAAAAAKQVQITIASETGLGAKASNVSVSGHPAHVLLRDGGLIDLQYGNWTLALAVQNGFLKGDQPTQLTKFAELALTRVLKSGS